MKKIFIIYFILSCVLVVVDVIVIHNDAEYTLVSSELTSCKSELESIESEINNYNNQLEVIESKIEPYNGELQALNDLNTVLAQKKYTKDIVHDFPTIYYNPQYDITGYKATIAGNKTANALTVLTGAIPGVNVVTTIMANCAKYNNKYYYSYMSDANNVMMNNVAEPLANFTTSMTQLRSKFDYYEGMLNSDSWSNKLINARKLSTYGDIDEDLQLSTQNVVYDAAVLYNHYAAIKRVYYFILDFTEESNEDYLSDLDEVMQELEELVSVLSDKDITSILTNEELLSIYQPYNDLLCDTINRSATAALGADITGMQMYSHQVYERISHGLSDFKLGIYYKIEPDMSSFVCKHFSENQRGWGLEVYYDAFGQPVRCCINSSLLQYSSDGTCINSDLNPAYERQLYQALCQIAKTVKHKEDTETFCEVIAPIVKAYDENKIEGVN